MKLQVVWTKPWIADEFEAAGVPTIRHLGVDTVVQEGPIWWATEHAARSIAAGNETWLTAPNWYDFVALPRELLVRDVWATTIGMLAETTNLTAFVKSADSKIVGPGDIGRARVDVASRWADECMTAWQVPGDTPALVSEPVDWSEEWRVWTDGEHVLEMSLYQLNGDTWNEWPAEKPPAHVREFAERAVRAVDQPCVIDIGKISSLPNHPLAIVELNPVWSSGPYTSDYAAIFRALRASYEWARTGRGRAWYPDPWLRKRFSSNVSGDGRLLRSAGPAPI